MKKIPNVFVRDWNGNRSLVLPEYEPASLWVRDGEGTPTRKLDGTACLIRDYRLYRRREIRPGQPIPPDFELVETDSTTGKSFGWVPVRMDSREDNWHSEAWGRLDGNFSPGTYELVGPKIQGNPEGFPEHVLIPHGQRSAGPIPYVPRTFEALRYWLEDHTDIEGVVWHHSDGRMAKVKLSDFGIRRTKA
jgi:Family of unknown function (DUF5565)